MQEIIVIVGTIKAKDGHVIVAGTNSYHAHSM